ncbi:hypothetical protein EV189_1673 [Motilibacter rhizosphaerae]|uniref:Uncharacterized protein n=1 Tax=Motilibacter rhizosphaerae TaxID=598652 RepID=A0A4Q7NSG0_9ACTN|nr:hypothetical protein [Motilibacter rhizosphaerae]RZS89894.1 hypothetical protein EV189_1673 [Motilibacter rhizosphaerae]
MPLLRSLPRFLPTAVLAAAVIAVVLAGSWDLADVAGVPARFALVLAGVATVVVMALGLSRVAARTAPTQETGPAELGLLFGGAVGVMLGAAFVILVLE